MSKQLFKPITCGTLVGILYMETHSQKINSSAIEMKWQRLIGHSHIRLYKSLVMQASQICGQNYTEILKTLIIGFEVSMVHLETSMVNGGWFFPQTHWL